MSEWTDAQEQRLRALIDGAQEGCAHRFAQLERIESENFERVLAACRRSAWACSTFRPRPVRL